MRTLLLITLITLISFSACKSPSQAMGKESIEPSNQKKSASKKQNDTQYDLIISFTSIAMGIDYEAKKKVDNIIESFNEDNKTSIIAEKISWGREGEVDYNFMLKNLSTSQKESFISTIKAGISTSETTHLFLNKKSVHKR